MTQPASISDQPRRRGLSAFTLVEVIIAIGITAFGVVALSGLLVAQSRSILEARAKVQAVSLGDALAGELDRLRDEPDPAFQNKLDRLASLIPASDRAEGLRLVASLDGLRVAPEDEWGAGEEQIPRAEQFFLVELRRCSGELEYVSGAGSLSLTATIRWPYQVRTGPGLSDAVTSDVARMRSLVLNLAVGI
jgi:hypothetical protein